MYETAVQCVLNAELGLDPAEDFPGRNVVRHIGESLVKAMEMAKAEGAPEAAPLVACECVVEAETPRGKGSEDGHRSRSSEEGPERATVGSAGVGGSPGTRASSLTVRVGGKAPIAAWRARSEPSA